MNQIAVLITCHNRKEKTLHCLQNLYKQSITCDVYLVDDGSIDGSSELCDNFALKDKRVKVIHQKNAGICKATSRTIRRRKRRTKNHRIHKSKLDRFISFTGHAGRTFWH